MPATLSTALSGATQYVGADGDHSALLWVAAFYPLPAALGVSSIFIP
jgi:hypothetical protein